jgi:hypothetical protein
LCPGRDRLENFDQGFFKSSGSLAILLAIRRASSLVSME